MSSFNQITLQTDRLILRPLSPPDAPALFAIFSDPRVMTYGSMLPWSSIEAAEKRIERDLKSMSEGDYLCLGLFRRTDDQLLGDCSLFKFDEQCRRAEIGYGMAHAAWGQGYMQEALTALIAYGFNALNLHRIEADIDPRNSASARSLERQGFAVEGLLRERWIVDGVVSDSAIYGLLVTDWAAKNRISSGE